MMHPDAARTSRPWRIRAIAPDRKRTLARVAGWTAVAFGAVHTVVAPLDKLDVWREVFEQGPWRTISLTVDAGNLAYSEAFWVAPASLGVPVSLIGALVLWATARGERIPAAFGWAIVAWSLVLAALLPASPIWALLLIGVLLVLAADGQAADGRSAGVEAREDSLQR